jgi:hypothetical protein
MPDTFPLLLKEGKLFYTVSHSSPELKLTAMPPEGGEIRLSYEFFSSSRGDATKPQRGF